MKTETMFSANGEGEYRMTTEYTVSLDNGLDPLTVRAETIRLAAVEWAKKQDLSFDINVIVNCNGHKSLVRLTAKSVMEYSADFVNK